MSTKNLLQRQLEIILRSQSITNDYESGRSDTESRLKREKETAEATWKRSKGTTEAAWKNDKETAEATGIVARVLPKQPGEMINQLLN